MARRLRKILTSLQCRWLAGIVSESIGSIRPNALTRLSLATAYCRLSDCKPGEDNLLILWIPRHDL